MKTENEFILSVHKKYKNKIIRKKRNCRIFLSLAISFTVVFLAVFFEVNQGGNFEISSFDHSFVSSDVTSESSSFQSEEISEEISAEDENPPQKETFEDFIPLGNTIYGEKQFMGGSYLRAEETSVSRVNTEDLEYFFEKEEYENDYYCVGIRAIYPSTEQNIEFVKSFGIKKFYEKQTSDLINHFQSIGLKVKYMKDFDLFVTYMQEADLKNLPTPLADLRVYHLPYEFEKNIKALFE